jgi:hypothetical protein
VHVGDLEQFISEKLAQHVSVMIVAREGKQEVVDG